MLDVWSYYGVLQTLKEISFLWRGSWCGKSPKQGSFSLCGQHHSSMGGDFD